MLSYKLSSSSAILSSEKETEHDNGKVPFRQSDCVQIANRAWWGGSAEMETERTEMERKTTVVRAVLF